MVAKAEVPDKEVFDRMPHAQLSVHLSEPLEGWPSMVRSDSALNRVEDFEPRVWGPSHLQVSISMHRTWRSS